MQKLSIIQKNPYTLKSRWPSMLLSKNDWQIKNVKSITQIQGDIAKQIVNQHEEMEQLLKGLGLKKDLSYYSYNIMEQEGH